jgi:hypothetical protein
MIKNLMKKTKIWFACALALALAGTTLFAVEEGMKEGKATVRTVHGTVEYSDNGAWLPVKPNMKFGEGATIRTGADGTADISVNGTASAVRLTNFTTLQIPTMKYVGSIREGDTQTMLNLKSGAILGNVKKISANSRYEIMTPHGVAGIRGTDFQVEAIPTLDGKFTVRFDSITGVITVSAVINGTLVTHTLTTGTSWEIGEAPKKIDPQLLQIIQNDIFALIAAIEFSINNGFGPGPNHPGPSPIPPYPGGPPHGPQPSPPQGPGAS